MKVLIYAINGLGMGHLNRTLVLARGMRAADPSTQVHFVVDSPHFGLVTDSGFDVTKFPDRRHPLGYHCGREHRYEELPAMFDVLLEDWKPDVMLVDFLCKRALFQRVRDRRVRLAAILRKQRPASLRQLSMNRGAALVDAWLIPHDQEDWPLSQLPRRFRPRATHLGPVSRGLDASRTGALRESLWPEGSGPLILVTIGGGGAPESRATLQGVEEALRRSGREARLLLVYGPNYPGDIPTETGGSGLAIGRRRFVAELPEAIAAADLVVSNAGYNTMLELRAAGTPALIVPLATTGRDDQDQRAASFVQEGRGLLAASNVDDIEAKIGEVLDSGSVERREPETGRDPSVQGRLLLEALKPRA